MPRFEESAVGFVARLDPLGAEAAVQRAAIDALAEQGLRAAILGAEAARVGDLRLPSEATPAVEALLVEQSLALTELDGTPPLWLLSLAAGGRPLGVLAVEVPDPSALDRRAARPFAATLASALLQVRAHDAFEAATLEPLTEQLQNSLGTIAGNAGLLEQELGPADDRQEAVLEILDAVERCRTSIAESLGESGWQDDEDANPRAILGALIRVLTPDLPFTPVLQLDPGVQRARTSVCFGVVQPLFQQLFVAARDHLDEAEGRVTIRTARIEIAPGSRGDVRSGQYIRTTFVFDGGDLREALHGLRGLAPESAADRTELLDVAARAIRDGAQIEHTARAGRARVDVWLPERTGQPPRFDRTASDTTILVVEDESALLRVVARVLEREGYRVFSATGAGEAMALCERLLPRLDLLVADVSLPLMSGPEIAQRLLRRQPNLRILYMTASKDRAVSPSLRPLLVKPFPGRALVQAVQDLLTGDEPRDTP